VNERSSLLAGFNRNRLADGPVSVDPAQSKGGGERRVIGRIRKASFPAANLVERFDPARMLCPRRGVGTGGAAGSAGPERKYGLAVVIPTLCGCKPPGAGERLVNGLRKGRASLGSGRPGALIRLWWPGNGQS